MPESDVIDRSPLPATRHSIADELRLLGVAEGMTLLVHSSLSRLGWVCGGAHAVVLALMDAVGKRGTLVMPTHSSDLSDPVFWRNPPVPTAWWPTIREHMPAYDSNVTPTREMGQIVDAFRAHPGVKRSQHPQYSFAALGPSAEQVVEDHQFNDGLGDGSPLARVYDLEGSILLLGVGHDRNTSLHLAEYRIPASPNRTIINGAPVMRNGQRVWINLRDRELFSGDFEEIGAAFYEHQVRLDRQTPFVKRGPVGQCRAQLICQRSLVDFAGKWMEKHR